MSPITIESCEIILYFCTLFQSAHMHLNPAFRLLQTDHVKTKLW
jgi:hypothetical protein